MRIMWCDDDSCKCGDDVSCKGGNDDSCKGGDVMMIVVKVMMWWC